MVFKIGNIIVDRIQVAVAEDFSDNLLYTLTQLADATIETTATSKDAVDKDGTLIKRIWTGKTGTFTANNAMLNLNILGSMTGSGVDLAAAENQIQMPKILIVKADAKDIKLSNYVDGTVKVHGLTNSGTMTGEYTKSDAASESNYALTQGGDLSLPTGTEEDQFIIKYKRTVKDNGAVVRNKADQFPSTVRLTLKVLAFDPCTADTLRAAYIYLPSFQPSPETSISLTTDGQLSFNGDLQCDYCSADKELYSFFWAEEDNE